LCLALTTFAQEAQRDEPQLPKIIRKSGGVFQASATRRVEPTYPPLAKTARISGSVVVEVTVAEEGNVISARAISGHPLLKDSSVAAAKEWSFEPTKLDGVPVKVIGTITFNFTLDDSLSIEELEAMVRQNPGSAEAQIRLGDAYRASGRDDDAIAAYIESIRLKPDSAAYFELGRSYDRLNRYDEAREAYGQALSLNTRLDSAAKPSSPLPPRAYLVIAQFHYRHNKYQDAVEVLKEAAALYPDADEVHTYLGQTYLELGDKHAAQNEYNALKDKETGMARRLLQRIENKE
jgi:TonB family protein